MYIIYQNYIVRTFIVILLICDKKVSLAVLWIVRSFGAVASVERFFPADIKNKSKRSTTLKKVQKNIKSKRVLLGNLKTSQTCFVKHKAANNRDSFN